VNFLYNSYSVTHIYRFLSLTVYYTLRLFYLLRFYKYSHKHSLTLTLAILDFSIPPLFTQAQNILFHTCVTVTWRSLLWCNAAPHFTNSTDNIYISENVKALKKNYLDTVVFQTSSKWQTWDCTNPADEDSSLLVSYAMSTGTVDSCRPLRNVSTYLTFYIAWDPRRDESSSAGLVQSQVCHFELVWSTTVSK